MFELLPQDGEQHAVNAVGDDPAGEPAAKQQPQHAVLLDDRSRRLRIRQRGRRRLLYRRDRAGAVREGVGTR